MNLNCLLSVTAVEVFTYIGYGLVAILSLMVMIVIHEFGHFIAGRALGFKINEFSIGFGPAIFKRFDKKGTQFTIRPFPIGGYCAFAGEDKNDTDPQAFNNQKPWKRLIVLFNGAFFNFLSAIIFISIFFTAYGQILPLISSADPIVKNNTTIENPLQAGDVILAINGLQVNILMPEDMNTCFAKAGDSAKFRVLRAGRIQTVTASKHHYSPFEKGDMLFQIAGGSDDINFDRIEDEKDYIPIEKWIEDNKGKIAEGTTLTFGIKRGDNEIATTGTFKTVEDSQGWYFYGFGVTRSFVQQKLNFAHAFLRSFGFAFFVVFKILASLGALLTGKIALSSAGGTITILQTMTQTTMQGGFGSLLYMISIISANLAVMNLLPFPALDGARMVFTLIEMIFKKPIPRKIEGIIHTVGLILLLVFAVFLDIFHLVS